MTETPDSDRDVRAGPARRPYGTPTLTIFGGVADLTGTASMDGSKMDGGPNNSKS